MKGWKMTVKMKIIKDFIKGIDKIRSCFLKRRRFKKKKKEKKKKKGENVIRQETRTKPYTSDLGYILIC